MSSNTINGKKPTEITLQEAALALGFSPKAKITIVEAMSLPRNKYRDAVKRGVHKNLLFVTWGGLGDIVCSVPAIQFMVDTFNRGEGGYKFTLLTPFPELFTHIVFEAVYAYKDIGITFNSDDYLSVWLNSDPMDSLTDDFVSHAITNCVDHPAIHAFRGTLPISYKRISLPSGNRPASFPPKTPGRVLIHAGNHWQSKTFPATWWNEVIYKLRERGETPILIGNLPDEERGTVDVDNTGCLDMRGKTTLSELIWLCRNAPVIVTNDSAPLHIAAAGNARIITVTFIKDPDYLKHWRWNPKQGKLDLGYEELFLQHDGIWNQLSYAPAQEEQVRLETIPEEFMLKNLPLPEAVVKLAIEGVHAR